MDPSILGMQPEDITGLRPQQWCTRVLQGFIAAALEHRGDPNGMFVNYGELPNAICGRIAKHFALGLSAEEEKQILDATYFDARNPGLEFEKKRGEKSGQIENLGSEGGLDELRSSYRVLVRGGS